MSNPFNDATTRTDHRPEPDLASTVDDVARPPGPSAEEPPIPEIAGYRIVRLLGKGGMGAVWEAIEIALDRPVAIKTLLPRARPERFLRESMVTARLSHPNIPPVFSIGSQRNGSHYLTMKLVAGKTLADHLKARPNPSEGLSDWLQAFELICQAVGHAHDRGILHRDLKTGNVMVGAFGEVQVMDWGLAKLADDSPAAESIVMEAGEGLTLAGTVMGTPHSIAPEQARGELVGPQADVFSLGSILAAILTGLPAFGGMSAAEALARSREGDVSAVRARLQACGARPT